MEKEIKPFEEVKKGDMGVDYLDQPVYIVDKGTIKEMCAKYKMAGFTEEDFIDADCELTDPAVYIEEPGPYYTIYTYGHDGVVVYKK